MTGGDIARISAEAVVRLTPFEPYPSGQVDATDRGDRLARMPLLAGMSAHAA